MKIFGSKSSFLPAQDLCHVKILSFFIGLSLNTVHTGFETKMFVFTFSQTSMIAKTYETDENIRENVCGMQKNVKETFECNRSSQLDQRFNILYTVLINCFLLL